MLRLELDHRFIEIEDGRGNLTAVDPEFQTILLRVVLVGSVIGIAGAAALVIAFRAFAPREKSGTGIRPFVILVGAIAFILVACIVLVILSYPTRP